VRLGAARRPGAPRHADGRWLRFDPPRGPALTKLYDWYASDFLQAAPSVEEYVAAHELSVRAALGAGQKLKVRWLPYDWSLNRGSEDRAAVRPSMVSSAHLHASPSSRPT
jgi:hypothetical protein